MYAPVTLMRVLSTEYLVSSAEKLWLGDGVMSSRILQKLLLTWISAVSTGVCQACYIVTVITHFLISLVSVRGERSANAPDIGQQQATSQCARFQWTRLLPQPVPERSHMFSTGRVLHLPVHGRLRGKALRRKWVILECLIVPTRRPWCNSTFLRFTLRCFTPNVMIHRL